MEQKGKMEKFMQALVQIAHFAEPNLVICEKVINQIEEISSTGSRKVKVSYTIRGYDGYTNEGICIESNGYVLNDKGQQISITKENNGVRFFPFFGFNWLYLEALKA